jgi:hypothetical protein
MTPPEGACPRAIALRCPRLNRRSGLAKSECDVGAGSEPGGRSQAGRRRSSRGLGR